MGAADYNRNSTSFKLRALFRSTKEGTAELGLPPAAVPPSAGQLYKAQDVQLTREKCKAAAVGALVADAAGEGVHWLSNSQWRDLVTQPSFADRPVFWGRDGNESDCGLSPWGVALLPLLESMVHHGGFDGLHFSHTSYEFFKSYSGHQTTMIRCFVSSVDKGATYPANVYNNGLDCLTKVPALVARYAGKPELETKMRTAVKVHQYNGEASVLSIAAAKILERVVLGCSIVAALVWAELPGSLNPHARQHVKTVIQSLDTPHLDFVAKHGSSEKVADTFLGSLHAAAVAGSYRDGICMTLKVGGAACGRAHLVAALLAAQEGGTGIPEQWQARIAKFSEFNELIDKLVMQRAIVTMRPLF